jgi:hypothetical protein
VFFGCVVIRGVVEKIQTMFRRAPLLRSASNRSLLIVASALLPAPLALAQIRMATYNIEADVNGVTTPRPGLDSVLQSIGSETVNGFARPLDILTLQETTSNATTVAPIVNSLNNFYGAGTYTMSPYQGTQAGNPDSGNGPNALVYNTHTLQLIASIGIYTPSFSGPPRQEIRYQFRPVGYGSNADFYVYVGHYKSASDSTSENRRNIEAQLVRADAATLPAGSRIVYTGDMNLFKGSSEPAWITLTKTGTGTLAANAGIDPINLGNGSWNGSNSAFVAGYTDSTTSLLFRDDVQMNTAPTMDGHGFSYITGSYHPFSNNGTIPLGGQSPNSSVRSASDHYPVVADYRLPARMGVSIGAVPSQVITGASVPVNVTVTNTAPVAVSIGADGLDYSVTSSGSLSGTGSGTGLLALTAGNTHMLTLNTDLPGTASGTVSVSSTSQEVANGTFSQQVSTQVLDHAHPELSVATIDFGIRGRTLGGASASFQISNLSGPGPTAGLDLDSITGNGDTTALTTTVVPFTNLPAGSNRNFTANIHDTSNGSFSASYTFNFSDQNLPGATTLAPKTLVLTGIIATPGDTDLNDTINFDDYVRTDNGFNNGLTGWANGDFDSNGVVNFDDYVLIDLFFNMQNGGGNSALRRAQRWLAGESSPKGIDPSVLSLLEHHLDEFGQDYAHAFVAAVPESSAVVLVGGAWLLVMPHRSRRCIRSI